MLNIRFLLIVSFLLVGLGPATAQNRIFVDKRDEASRSQKPSIYVRRSPSDSSMRRGSGGRSWDSRNDKLRNAQNMKSVADKIAVFHAWQKSGRKPETLEEIQSYAMSKRAVHQGAMLERRKRLIAHLEKKERLRQRMLASGGSSGAPSSVGAFGSSGEGVSEEQPASKTRTTIIKKPRVFVSPGGNDSERSGPYTRYR